MPKSTAPKSASPALPKQVILAQLYPLIQQLRFRPGFLGVKWQHRVIEFSWRPGSGALKIRIGQSFRVEIGRSHNGATDSYNCLTKGNGAVGADAQKGIFFYRDVPEPSRTFRRMPAFLFYSNSFKSGSEEAPWVDIIEPDLGYALFHGDNRSSERGPMESRGNARFSGLQHFYSDPELRQFAPPILLFAQVEVDGNRKGFRKFCGYGVPTHSAIATQKDLATGRYFTNLVLELALFNLDRENELFDWNWIDARRDPAFNSDELLRAAPQAWRNWVSRGDLVLESCRRRIARHRVIKPKLQLSLSKSEGEILEEVLGFFCDSQHSFEGLAALVAERVIGPGCERQWVTKRSGDGGVDFVCRLGFGDPADALARIPLVVLGQAKCLRPESPVNGQDLARLVARLQRGWVGVFVTTGYISTYAQQELLEDKYPILLINGKRLAQELQKIVITERCSLREVLERENAWYNTHVQPIEPRRVLDLDFSRTVLKLGDEN